MAGANVTKHFLDKEIFKEVQAAYNKDQEAMQEFQTACKGIESLVQRVNKLGKVKELLLKLFNSPLFSGCKGLKSLGKNIM